MTKLNEMTERVAQYNASMITADELKALLQELGYTVRRIGVSHVDILEHGRVHFW